MKKYLYILTIFLLLGLVYSDLKPVYAHSISPIRQDITLASGQRKFSSVKFTNEDSVPIELKLGAYAYNTKTQEIDEDTKKIFLKLDTDTITVKAKSSQEVKYEIYPLENLELGTYFNVVTFTPVFKSEDVSFKNSIAQLVVLNLITPDDDVKGITTTNFDVSIQVVDKGIPFVKPAVLKYSIQNNSNYVIQPDGGIVVSSTGYKPTSFTVNPESKKLYPKESLEGEVKVTGFHPVDLIFDRPVTGHFYNGLDSQPKDVTLAISSYKFELVFAVAVLIGGIVVIKSLRNDNKEH